MWMREQELRDILVSKKVRLYREGTRPYYAFTQSGWRFAAVHNHANNIRTIGLGESSIVLNGVEFRTRHNDYSLVMPSRTSTEFHSVEDIEFPDVPDAVTNKPSLEEEIEEMRQWFKAWRDQDASQRDYTQYFKPVLCYMEGAWFYPDSIPLDGFASDRHTVAADSFEDLKNKIKFTSETGRKQNHENFSYLPTKIVEVRNNTPVYAQWNYRILCHPLSRDVPLNRYRAVDDLAARMRFRLTYEEYKQSSAARFQINPIDSGRFRDLMTMRGYLDELMEEIPGKNNYPASFTDDAFGQLAHSMTRDESGAYPPLNTGYYHRWYRANQGTLNRHRAFNDETLFMAMTDHPQVVPSEETLCSDKAGNNCAFYSQR